MSDTSKPLTGDERREIIRLAEELLRDDWDDIHLATEHWELTLRRRHAAGLPEMAEESPVPAVAPPAAVSGRAPVKAPDGPRPAPATQARDQAAVDGDHPSIDAPMAGTFYRCPAPGAPPFVQEGDLVEAGQTVAIIEVMKLMYEVKADQRATVHRICASDGQPVRKGQALIRLETVAGG